MPYEAGLTKGQMTMIIAHFEEITSFLMNISLCGTRYMNLLEPQQFWVQSKQPDAIYRSVG